MFSIMKYVSMVVDTKRLTSTSHYIWVSVFITWRKFHRQLEIPGKLQTASVPADCRRLKARFCEVVTRGDSISSHINAAINLKKYISEYAVYKQ